VGYASASSMTELLACPFCRETFRPERARQCPSCGLALRPVDELPPELDASLDDEPIAPEDEVLAWTYPQRGRGALALLALLGIAAFFLPWAHETMPERVTLSGAGLARHLGWVWAPFVAWFVMLPLVVSRRTIRRMRGARVAVCFLAGMALVTVAVRVLFPPPVQRLDPHVLEWGVGLWATGVIAVASIAVGLGFGGSLERLTSRVGRRPDDVTLH
jgi:hypothetical protein